MRIHPRQITKTAKERNHGMRKIWMTAMLLLMIVCILCGCSGTDYKEAGKLLEQGNYEEARVLYQQLEIC